MRSSFISPRDHHTRLRSRWMSFFSGGPLISAIQPHAISTSSFTRIGRAVQHAVYSGCYSTLAIRTGDICTEEPVASITWYRYKHSITCVHWDSICCWEIPFPLRLSTDGVRHYSAIHVQMHVSAFSNRIMPSAYWILDQYTSQERTLGLCLHYHYRSTRSCTN
jgi:hypothetical protein